MEKQIIKNILYSLLLLLSNVILIKTFILFYGDNIIIEYKIKPEIIISLILISTLSILILAKALSKYFEIRIANIFTWLITIFFGTSFISYILSYIGLVYKLLNYHELLYNGKFLKIYYQYDKTDLLYYIEVYYKKISGNTQILNLSEQLKILGDAKTVIEVQKNVIAYHNQKLNSWWPKLMEYGSQTLTWCFDHPYITGTVIIAISSLMLKPIWLYLQSQIEISRIASNVDSLNNIVSTHTSSVVSIQNTIHDIYKELLNQNTLSTILAKTLYGYFTEFNTHLDTQKDTEELRNFRTLLLKLSLSLKDQIQKALTTNENLVQQEEIQNQINQNNNRFIPFSGEDHLLGGTATRSRLLDSEN